MNRRLDPDVRRASLAAVISACVSAALATIALTADDDLDGYFDVFGFVDAAVLFFLAYWVRRYSRIAISVLIVFFALSKLYQYWNTGKTGALIGLAIFGYFFAMGAVAIFTRQRDSHIAP